MPNRIIKELQENYLLILILLLAAILRFFHLDFQSPWLDEIHTLNESNPNNPLSAVYGQILSGEQMPPLYFYLIYIFFKIFGYTIFVARFFSAFIGLATVYGIYILAKKLTNDKKVGLLAALFMCLNYFMVFYSQEARPYALLTFFVVFSYYKMICFLEAPTKVNAIWYGIFASLMVHVHFIGFFVLFAQFVTLIFYFIQNKEINKPFFFRYSLITLVVFLIVYIPAIHSLLTIFEIKEFWIPIPTKDAFESIYHNFFGNSEIIIFLNFIFIIAFIISLSKYSKSFKPNREKDLTVQWTPVTLILWISMSILVPLVRSYISNPIILDRYFIIILPAIIIVLAIGLKSFNRTIRPIFICIYIVFCLIDFGIVKKFYSTVKQAQFREATDYIIEHNLHDDKVVSSLSWYLPYFFNKSGKNYEIIGSTFDDFIKSLKDNDSSLEPFWYFDGHDRTFNPNQETVDFLNKNYIVEHNYSGFQAWTRHYIIKKSENLIIHFSDQELNDLMSNQHIMNNIENFNYENNNLYINGWALLRDLNSKNTKIQLILLNGNTGYKIETLEVLRPDVTSYFKLNYNADYSGFETSTSLNNLPYGNYTLGILLKNEEENKFGLFLYDKKISVL